jgi:hypothetical protein
MIRESISNGAVRVNFVCTKENLVDPLTEGLNREKVQDTSSRLGLIHIAGNPTYMTGDPKT